MDAEDGKGLTFPRGTAFLALPAGRLALRVQTLEARRGMGDGFMGEGKQ
jgi:hypothetical protein